MADFNEDFSGNDGSYVNAESDGYSYKDTTLDGAVEEAVITNGINRDPWLLNDSRISGDGRTTSTPFQTQNIKLEYALVSFLGSSLTAHMPSPFLNLRLDGINFFMCQIFKDGIQVISYEGIEEMDIDEIQKLTDDYLETVLNFILNIQRRK